MRVCECASARDSNVAEMANSYRHDERDVERNVGQSAGVELKWRWNTLKGGPDVQSGGIDKKLYGMAAVEK